MQREKGRNHRLYLSLYGKMHVGSARSASSVSRRCRAEWLMSADGSSIYGRVLLGARAGQAFGSQGVPNHGFFSVRTRKMGIRRMILPKNLSWPIVADVMG